MKEMQHLRATLHVRPFLGFSNKIIVKIIFYSIDIFLFRMTSKKFFFLFAEFLHSQINVENFLDHAL